MPQPNGLARSENPCPKPLVARRVPPAILCDGYEIGAYEEVAVKVGAFSALPLVVVLLMPVFTVCEGAGVFSQITWPLFPPPPRGAPVTTTVFSVPFPLKQEHVPKLHQLLGRPQLVCVYLHQQALLLQRECNGVDHLNLVAPQTRCRSRMDPLAAATAAESLSINANAITARFVLAALTTFGLSMSASASNRFRRRVCRRQTASASRRFRPGLPGLPLPSERFATSAVDVDSPIPRRRLDIGTGAAFCNTVEVARRSVHRQSRARVEISVRNWPPGVRTSMIGPAGGNSFDNVPLPERLRLRRGWYRRLSLVETVIVNSTRVTGGFR